MTRTHATPLVGRELEKPLLIGTFERAAQQRSCQLVTIVGEPGVGKSRLCAELFALHRRAARPRPLAPGPLPALRGGDRLLGARGDRQGRVRHPRVRLAARRPRRSSSGRCPRTTPTAPGSRPAWRRSSARRRSPPSQEESFTAWRRFLESLAEAAADRARLRGPALGRRGAARLPRAPGRLVGGRAAAPALHRPPGALRAAPDLGGRTAQRDHDQPRPAHRRGDGPPASPSLLERAVLPAETQRALLERAGGNPLYAEEFVRLLADRGEPAEVEEVPDSVQALIAARLDTLSPERKSLLQDAAVIGKVFWAGALAEMGGRDPREVEQALHELCAQGARAPRPHQLDGGRGRVRLLAPAGPGRLLRADPARRPCRPPPRGGRLDRAARRASASRTWPTCSPTTTCRRSSSPGPPARRDAGRGAGGAARSATSPSPASARSRSTSHAREQSLAQGARARPRRPPRARLAPRALGAGGAATGPAARRRRRRSRRRSPSTASRARPWPPAASLTALANVLARLGDPRREEAIAEALALLEAQPPGPELVAAYAQLAANALLDGRLRGGDRGRRAGARARRRARPARAGARARLPRPRPLLPGRAAGARGHAPARSQLALEQGQGRDAAVLHNNLALASWLHEGPQAALAACREGIDFCERRGIAELALAIAARALTFLAELGQTRAGARRGRAAGRSPAGRRRHQLHRAARAAAALARRARRTPSTPRPRTSSSPRRAKAATRTSARWRSRPPPGCCSPKGDPRAGARRCWPSSTRSPASTPTPTTPHSCPGSCARALALDDAALAEQLVDGVEPRHAARRARARRQPAQLAEAAGDHAEAADALRRGGRALARVRERPRARLRPARPGPLLSRRSEGPRRSRCARRASSSPR